MPFVAPGLAALALVLAGLPEAYSHALALERDAVAAGAFTRLWTGHLVHFSWAHALADALAVLAGGVVAERAMGSRRLLAVLLAAAPAISLALLAASPALAHYRGLSGLAWMLGALAVVALWRSAPAARAMLAAVAAIALAKFGLDAAALAPANAWLPDGVGIEWRAHGLGIAAALAGAALSRRFPPSAVTPGAFAPGPSRESFP